MSLKKKLAKAYKEEQRIHGKLNLRNIPENRLEMAKIRFDIARMEYELLRRQMR
jgi:hypothetical protein